VSPARLRATLLLCSAACSTPAASAPAGSNVACAQTGATTIATSDGEAAPSTALPVTTWRVRTRNGQFELEVSPIPDPLPLNEQFKLMIVVCAGDRPGYPDPNARVQLDATMPEHGHGMYRRPRVTRLGDGVFLVEGMLFHMRGLWAIEFAVFSGYRSGQATLSIDLG
jgi:hypothetical protein